MIVLRRYECIESSHFLVALNLSWDEEDESASIVAGNHTDIARIILVLDMLESRWLVVLYLETRQIMETVLRAHVLSLQDPASNG